LEFAKGKNAFVLAMPMGSGKTRCAIEILKRRRPNRVLVVSTPKIAADPSIWPAQLQRFGCKRYNIEPLVDMPTKKRAAIWRERCLNDEHVLATINNEAVWRRPFQQVLAVYRPDAVIWDESHHIRTPRAKVSLAAAHMQRIAPLRIELTGSFVTESPMNAWSQMRFINPGVFSSSFRGHLARYAIMGGYEGKEVLSGRNGVPWLRMDEYAQLLKPWVFTCKKPELPFDTEHIERFFDLGEPSRSQWDEMEEENVASFEGCHITAQMVLTKELRLRQISSGWFKMDDLPGRLGTFAHIGNDRQQAVQEMFFEIDAHDPIVVFAEETRDMDSIHEAARKASRFSFEISGRRSEAAEWRKSSGGVLVVQVRAGAEGADYTHARFVSFYTQPLSGIVYEQALARVERPRTSTHTGTLCVVHLLASGTHDSIVRGALSGKLSVAEALMARVRAKATGASP
jgi:hypothetical protein